MLCLRSYLGAFTIALCALSAACTNLATSQLPLLGTSGSGSVSNDDSTNSDYSGGTGKISVSWNANREAAVNSSGGGYRVYYSTSQTISGTTPSVNVPYVSGASAPTSATITGLQSGTYYVSVVAYSSVNASGSTAAQTKVVVP